MAGSNPQWKTFEKTPEALVIFHGAHTYISPTWYNHVNVPTWNYQAVHLYGKPQIIEDREQAYLILERLVDRHEANGHYKLETLPPEFVSKEIRGIVAFQIEVRHIEANYKLSQNRSDEDYRNVILQLENREDEMSHAVAEAMSRQRLTR
jgi:transcriptional regulator